MPIETWTRRGRRKPVFVEGPTTEEVALGRQEIEWMVPHRDPFLLVEGIDRVDLEAQTIRGFATIDPEDPVLAGHFPGYPLYPGVLQMEMVGQLSLCLYHLLCVGRNTPAPDDTCVEMRLLKLHHATFLAEVGPGERIQLASKLLEQDSYTVTCAGQVLKSDGTICALAIMEVYLVDDE